MKYGFLTVTRTPVKTVTFFLLITAITVFLSLGFGMWQSAETMLNEADAVFTTAADFVYTGNGSFNHLYLDEGLEAASAAFDLDLINRDETLFMEENITQRAYIKDYNPSTRDMPLKNLTILAVNIRHYDDDTGGYAAVVTRDIYSTYSLQDTYVYLLCDRDSFQFEDGHRYVILGNIVESLGSTIKCLEPLLLSDLPFDTSTYDYSSITDITEYENVQDFLDTDGKFYMEIAALLEVLNNSVDVTATKDINIVENFHRGRYTLMDGNFFDNSDANVCIVPKRVSSQMGLSVGDTINLSFHYPTAKTGRYSSYYPDTGFAAENLEYRVVGIYQSDELTSPVFIPNAGQSWLGRSDNDYVLARVSVDNRRSAAYSAAIKDVLPANISFDLYDQGYEAAVMPINTLRDTAIMISVFCLVLCVFILWLFGFLFINRNERNAKMLLALGAGKKRVLLYFLSGGGAISVLASIVGAILGYFISKNVFSSVYESIVTNSVYDFRFSIISYGVRSETFAVKPEVNPVSFILLAAAVAFMSLLFCFFFAARVIQRQNPRYMFKVRKKAERASAPAQPKHAFGSNFAMFFPTSALRYGIKSVLRGGRRSLVVPLLFTVMLFFICIFHNINAGFQTRLDTVYDDIPVTMRFSDMNGKKVDGLLVTSIQTDAVKELGFVKQAWTSYNDSFMVSGISQYADGTQPTTPLESFVPPPSTYARETFMEQWSIRSDKNIFLKIESGITGFERAPEFAYTTAPEIRWADGYNENDFFNSADDSNNMIIVSDDFLSKHNVSPGDTISVVYVFSRERFISGDSNSFYQLDLVIAGSFEGAANYPTVYSCSEIGGASYYESSYYHREPVFQYTMYHSAGFLLEETDRLSEFKDSLEGLFDPLGKAANYRAWVVIDDAALYSTVDNLTRYIGYMNMLYPVILALVAGIGFLVSHLLLKGRTGEIAILRGVGASKITVFFSYFNEQFLLSLLGAVAGLTAAALLLGGIGAISPLNVLLLVVCYYIGLAFAIINTYQKAAIEALAAKEE